MSDILTFKVEGLNRLLDALKKLPDEVSGRELRRAVSKGARVVKAAAKSNAPVATGRLKRVIYTVRDKDRSGRDVETYITGVRSGKRYQKKNNDAFYWRFVEFGTSKMAAKPFLRPAFDSTVVKQTEAMKNSLKRSIDRAAERLK